MKGQLRNNNEVLRVRAERPEPESRRHEQPAVSGGLI